MCPGACADNEFLYRLCQASTMHCTTHMLWYIHGTAELILTPRTSCSTSMLRAPSPELRLSFTTLLTQLYLGAQHISIVW